MLVINSSQSNSIVDNFEQNFIIGSSTLLDYGDMYRVLPCYGKHVFDYQIWKTRLLGNFLFNFIGHYVQYFGWRNYFNCFPYLRYMLRRIKSASNYLKVLLHLFCIQCYPLHHHLLVGYFSNIKRKLKNLYRCPCFVNCLCYWPRNLR
jgi:hypothetical protein